MSSAVGQDVRVVTDRRLVLLTSSFPRWKGDDTTPFVLHFAHRIAAAYGQVQVVAPHFAGAATTEELADHLTVQRFRYFLPYSGEDIAYGGNAVGRVRRTPAYAVKVVLFLLSSFVTLLRQRSRLVNVHWLVPQGFVAVAVKSLTGLKVVVTVHGGDVFSLNHRFVRAVKRWILRRADVVVTNSEVTQRACEDLYPDRSYQVIPMGVDTDRFRPGPRSPALVARHDLRDFTVLFVGRLTEDKGPVYLIEALGRLKESGLDFSALIIGSGDQEEHLKRRASELGLDGDVSFLGWIASGRLPEYYNVADVLVGPSIVGARGWQEALGLVFIEALACGVPVIATRTGGIADVVDDGVTGFLVEQRSSEQIFERLAALHGDRQLLRDLGLRGRAAVCQRFSWETVTAAYSRVFEQLS